MLADDSEYAGVTVVTYNLVSLERANPVIDRVLCEEAHEMSGLLLSQSEDSRESLLLYSVCYVSVSERNGEYTISCRAAYDSTTDRRR